jgi:hypothetical protein
MMKLSLVGEGSGVFYKKVHQYQAVGFNLSEEKSKQ